MSSSSAQYDENGRLKSNEDYFDGEFFALNSYYYDSDGNLVKETLQYYDDTSATYEYSGYTVYYNESGFKPDEFIY